MGGFHCRYCLRWFRSQSERNGHQVVCSEGKDTLSHGQTKRSAEFNDVDDVEDDCDDFLEESEVGLTLFNIC